MKKYIILFALIFSFSACKDFLEEKTVTTLTQDFYKTADGSGITRKGLLPNHAL